MLTIVNSTYRKNYIEIGKIYFWTATIHKWHKLLLQNSYKEIIKASLNYLNDQNKIDVFGFVIMPNHIHLIWRINEMNGKETVQGSFLKYTAHEFKKKLIEDNTAALNEYRINAYNKQFEFWQRDTLAIELFSSKVAQQKLDYIHRNPLAAHWNLSASPEAYEFSSASFYENNNVLGSYTDEPNKFKFLKDIRNEFPTVL